MSDLATHQLTTQSASDGDSAVCQVQGFIVGLAQPDTEDRARRGTAAGAQYACDQTGGDDQTRSLIITCHAPCPSPTLGEDTGEVPVSPGTNGIAAAPGDSPVATAPPSRLPSRRPDLMLRPLGDRGRYVVKDPRTGAFFTFGEQESFLLDQLDGERDADSIRQAFQERFGEPLSEDDLAGFVGLAEAKGFLLPVGAPAPAVDSPECPKAAGPQPAPLPQPAVSPAPTQARQSILYWRKNFFDPDRFFTWLEPHLRFIWTRSFVVLSAGCILLAALLAWSGRDSLVSSLAHAWRWETALIVWLTLMATTFCHEFAHGLTCKHHGGEVHEVGFLALFFMPCFYCNVSDAWLMREKSKRLWVTLAGGYCDLCLWALAVFAWHLSAPASQLNYVAWVVLSVLAVRVFFNFNPLLKLDGYYLLSDWLEIPNLRQRAWDRVACWSRWLLWGAARPTATERSRFLLVYGLASLLFSVAFLSLMIVGFYQLLGARLGLVGAGAAGLLGVVSMRGLFRGFNGGEVRNMVRIRHKRLVVWLLILGGFGAWLAFGEMEDRVSGTFEVRPAARAEVRAPVAGFIHCVHFDEGEQVSPGAVVVLLDVPDLASRQAQKRAKVREAEARLTLLKAGPRPEEIGEQRGRVARAQGWRDLAERDLARARKGLEDELTRLDREVAVYQAEMDYFKEIISAFRALPEKQALARQEFREAEKQLQVSSARKEQAEAQTRARRTLGTQLAEEELARRVKELADAQATLRLLEVGPRPEEVQAEEAKIARLREEAYYLESITGKLRICSPFGGVVATPRLKEKVGQFVREGELICVVEDSAALQIEITLAEEDAGRLRPGQTVELKCRAFPLETFTARLDRIAPRAVLTDPPTTAPSSARRELPSTVVVHCRLEGADANLRPGMTGQARIQFAQRRIGEVLSDRFVRYLRGEWWW